MMDVMEEREALAEARAARNLPKVRALASVISQRARIAEEKLIAGFANGSPSRDELQKLLPILGELRFYQRFLDEVEAIEEEAEEQAALHASGVSP